MKVPEYSVIMEVDSTLLSLWKLFHFSPQRNAVFLSIQEVYGQTPLIINRAATTRWMSHLKACERVMQRYIALLDCLDSLYEAKKEPEVFGIRQHLVRKDIVCTILLLCDILKPLDLLNLYLQEDEVNFTILLEKVRNCIHSLEDLIEKYRNENYESTAFEQCQEIFSEIDERTPLARRMRRNDGQLTSAEYVTQTGIPIIYSLMNEIDDAFHSTPVLKAFGFLDPRNLPLEAEEMANYGNVSLTKVYFWWPNQPVNFLIIT